MAVVFFIYGLAFFLLGFAVLLYPKKDSSFALAQSIRLIAWFGILHGINEWLDMFILINRPIDPLLLEIIRMATLPISFVFLVHFGARILKLGTSKPHTYRYFTLTLVIVWAVVFLAGDHSFLMWDIWSRYILCIPGAFLTGVALLRYVPQVESVRVARVTRNLKLAGVTFIAYAFLAGAIVKPAGFFPASVLNYDVFISVFGMPVQILRSICAVLMAYSLIRVLDLFRWEIKRNLQESQLRLNTIANQIPVILFGTDKDLRITFIEGKGLDSLNASSAQLLGEHISTVFGDTDGIADCCRTALQGHEFTSTIKTENSILQLFYGPLRDQDYIRGTIGVAIDITAESNARAALDAYRDGMVEQRALAEIGTVSTEMVQKLSVPVASTRAFVMTAIVALRKIHGGSSLKEALENALEQASKTTDIIDGFYNFADITPNPKADPVDVEQIIQQILAVFNEKINRTMLHVKTTNIGIAPCLFISKRELEQIFFVLVQNVIQAANGENIAELSINCSVSGGQLHILFSDNCGSIVLNDPNDAFEAFSEPRDASAGYSFGLAIIKRLVLAYDGTIDARRKDADTIVEITLPVKEIE
jgi:signal transduction histidine kinase